MKQLNQTYAIVEKKKKRKRNGGKGGEIYLGSWAHGDTSNHVHVADLVALYGTRTDK